MGRKAIITLLLCVFLFLAGCGNEIASAPTESTPGTRMDANGVVYINHIVPSTYTFTTDPPYVAISFAMPMDKASVENALQITPSVTYKTRWSGNNLLITFVSGYAPNQSYTVSLANPVFSLDGQEFPPTSWAFTYFVPTPTLTQTPTTTPTPTLTPTPTQPPIPIHTLQEGEGMKSPGPWLLVYTHDEFWLVNHKGNDIGHFPNTHSFYLVRPSPAPSGGLLTFYADEDFYPLLQVISVRDWQVIFSQDLLAYDSEDFYDKDDKYELEMERFSNVGWRAWSSDGSKMAFTSSHLGPSPDVYLFDVETRQVTQLESIPLFVGDFFWSPDDKYIFFAEVDRLYMGYSGGGYSGWRFYASRVEDSRLFKVFDGIQERAYENLVGWYSDHEVVMNSGLAWCGDFGLRVVNIETGKITSILDKRFEQIAFDPIHKSVLIWVGPWASHFDDACGERVDYWESGFYLVSIPDGYIEKLPFDDRVTKDDWVRIEWSEEIQQYIVDITDVYWEERKDYDIMHIVGEESLLVNHEGAVEVLEGKVFFSPDGRKMALLDVEEKNLTIVDANGKTHTFTSLKGFAHPTWSPDGSRLFIFEKRSGVDLYDLYMAVAPDFKPVLILEKTISGGYWDAPMWVMP